MPLTGRGTGVTLVELLVALVLLGLVGGLLTLLLLRTERGTRAHEERAALHEAFDAGLGYATSELATLAPGDLLQAGPDSLRYRATRAAGFACAIAPDQIRVAAWSLPPGRALQPGRDSLLLAPAGDDPLPAESAWAALPLTSVGAGSCGGLAATVLGTAIDTSVLPLPLLPAPLRVFEVMQLRLYASGGSGWLGARSVSAGEVIQPLAGPFDLAASRLEARDSTGLPTTTPGAARALLARLAGSHAGWSAAGGTVAETAGITITPGNLQ